MAGSVLANRFVASLGDVGGGVPSIDDIKPFSDMATFCFAGMRSSDVDVGAMVGRAIFKYPARDRRPELGPWLPANFFLLVGGGAGWFAYQIVAEEWFETLTRRVAEMGEEKLL